MTSVAWENTVLSFRIPAQRYDTFAYTLFNSYLYVYSHGILKNFQILDWIVASNSTLIVDILNIFWNYF